MVEEELRITQHRTETVGGYPWRRPHTCGDREGMTQAGYTVP